MPTVKGGVYQRGEFWLDLVRGADGKPASDRWYIWWYDAAAGRQQRKSTRTSNVRQACDQLDQHYLDSHKPTAADQAAYTVQDAMADYWLDHGQHRSSEEAIKARLKLFQAFLEVEEAVGRLPALFIPEAIDDRMIERFRVCAPQQSGPAQRRPGQSVRANRGYGNGPWSQRALLTAC